MVSSEKDEEMIDYDELVDIPVEGITLEAIENFKKNKPKRVVAAEKQRDILALVDELEKSFEPAKKLISASDAKTASAKPPSVSNTEHSQSDVSEVEEVFTEEEEAAVAQEPAVLPLVTAGNAESVSNEGVKDTASEGDAEEETDKYSLGYWLKPQLDSSGLHLADLAFDTATSKVVPRPGQWQRIITIQKVANLSSLPDAGEHFVHLLNRWLVDLMEIKKCVRFCLCDGKTIIDPTQKSADLSDVFIRHNSENKDFSILFEVATTVRKLNSEETIEIGFGWATIPAYQEDGNPIQNK
ncbi:unnamed protein product [Schistocephalus solidus]|uniref:Structural protein n=1 Tax=Schistocephalus solidus TaxID=70667 RepID=A0A183T2U7_SCHSO|nr:unnamed protein product [Schistocephalus solidus]